MKSLQRVIATLLIICFSGATTMQAAQAALVPTEEAAAVAAGSEQPAKSRLNALLERADVQGEFERLGLSTDVAKARVAALTDSEAAMLADEIDRAPAGASDILGVALFIFVLLLVTDILGFTKIFPFTRSIR